MSGWHTLAQDYRATSAPEGTAFRWCTGRIGRSSWFPVNYSGCLFVTVGNKGLGLSVLVLLRIFSPDLQIPWSQIAAVSPQRWLFGRRTRVELKRSSVKLTLYGAAGDAVAAAFAAARKA